MIHATRWHDLGQYYCVVAGEVKAIYLLYQRPIILFAAPAKKLDKHNLLTPETIEEPSDFANRLNQLSEGFLEAVDERDSMVFLLMVVVGYVVVVPVVFRKATLQWFHAHCAKLDSLHHFNELFHFLPLSSSVHA